MLLQSKQLCLLNLMAGQLLLLWPGMLHSFHISPSRVFRIPRSSNAIMECTPRRSAPVMCGNSTPYSASVDSGVLAKTKRDSTWSNVGGEDLVQVSGHVWCAERPFVWNGIDVGGRMAVVKLSDDTLWVHSPVNLDEGLREALDKLGPVRHIVSPNYEHVKYARQWTEAFPSAKSYACPGLEEREPEVGFTRSVGDGPDDDSPPEWGGEIQALFMDCETNPFTGKPFFNEVVFFHRPSKALITSDLFWNYPLKVPLGTRVWKWGMDKVYLPFFKSLMVTDKRVFEDKVNHILAWGIDIIVPCHGDVVRKGASEALRETLLGKGPA